MYRAVASISYDELAQYFLLLVGGGQEGIVMIVFHDRVDLYRTIPLNSPLPKGRKSLIMYIFFIPYELQLLSILKISPQKIAPYKNNPYLCTQVA